MLLVVAMTPQELRQRTYQFALRILLLVKALPKSLEAQVIGRQLLRASTGMAANYRAAGRGRSKREFTAKIGIVLEEADESVLWLQLLIDGKIDGSASVQNLLTEDRELVAIFAASRQTATGRPGIESARRNAPSKSDIGASLAFSSSGGTDLP